MAILTGKNNWILIITVALIAGAVGGGLIVYINNTANQAAVLSQIAELKRPEKIKDTQIVANSIPQPVCGNGV